MRSEETTALLPTAEFRFKVRVYFEDTDSMNVVYHANYLKFMERARTEMMATTGTTVAQWAQKGLIFPIYAASLKFKAPARLCDDLVVVTTAQRASDFRISFDQRIERESDGTLLVEASVDVVCTDLGGKLRRLPDARLVG